MFKDMLPLIGVVVGAVLVGTANYILASLSRKAEKRAFLRGRLEELYILTEQVADWAQKEMRETVRVLLGSEKIERSNCPTSRLMMIVRLYHPALKPQAQELETSIELYRKSLFAYYGKMHESGGKKLAQEEYEGFLKPVERVNSACKALLESIELTVGNFF